MKIKISKMKALNDEFLNKGIQKYLCVMHKVDNTDFSADFTKLYNGFYRIRRNAKWQREYYKIFDKYRTKKKNGKKFYIKDIIEDIYQATGSIEFSFSTKLLHTLFPEKYPIYDMILANMLSLKKLKGGGDKKIENACNIYEELCNKIQAHKYLANDFEEIFAENKQYMKISDIKKIDFLIWWSGHQH